MKKTIFLGILLCFSFFSFSQANFQGGQMPTGSIYGKVVDSTTGKPIDAASVQLLQSKMDTATKKPNQVVIGGMLTSANGDFSIENISLMGQYTLKITGIGYKTHSARFTFLDKNAMSAMRSGSRDMNAIAGAMNKDLGNIKLGIDNQVLTGVTVTATKPSVQLGIDRKIFNVDKDLTSAGGTAVDVMKNIPAVNVDIDGNISIRNSSPQIFVDGRPTNLTLDQIPADQIESVEVITNPSAKYDASGGTAGILNIVLKKSKQVGYNGNVRAGIDQRGKVNFGGNVNIRQGKFNFFVNAQLGQRKSISNGTTERTTSFNSNTTQLLQTDKSTMNGGMMFARAGFDYFLDNRNTITIAGVGVRGKFDSYTNSNITVDSILSSGTNQSKIIRVSDGSGLFKNLGGSVGYVHNFPKSGHQLTSDFNYNRSNNENTNYVTNQTYLISTGPLSSTYKQQQTGKGNNERLTAQLDYTNPVSDKAKFETGLRINQSKIISDNNFNIVAPDGTFIFQPLLSSKFNYTDRVLAGYTNYSGKITENLGYQTGLRLESSNYKGTVYKNIGSNGTYTVTPVSFNTKYPVSLFPSIFLSQKLPHDQELQLSYSRRINRPGFFQLFPYTDYSDSLNLSRGNPDLKPEFVNSLELSYSKNFDKNNTLLLTAYYKTTKGLITRFQAKETNPLTNLPVLVNTFTNANSGFVGGFEAVSKNKLAKWWDLTSSINIYTSKINMDDPGIPTTGQLYSWFGKLNNSFKLYKNLTFQLSGDYNSKTVLSPGGSSSNNSMGSGRGFMGGSISSNAQGYSLPNYGVDAALRYDFLKNNVASLTLSVNDIFKTRISDVYTTSTYFTQHVMRTRDQQFFRLSFSYRFGKFDASLFKRKNLKSEQEGMQGATEGMGQ